MTEKDNVNDNGGFGYPLLGDVYHGSTVIAVNNRSELLYVLEWCKLKGKSISDHILKQDKFPYCLSVRGDIVGWTDLMDRALYYKSFSEFVGNVA